MTAAEADHSYPFSSDDGYRSVQCLNDPADADVEEGEILVAADGEVEEVEILDDAAITSAMEVDAESAACFGISCGVFW
jgi:hypothetical protein